MKKNMLTCAQCSKEFIVPEPGQEILKKMDMPTPTLCEQCSLQERLAFRNERNLSYRACAKCKKQALSMYAEDSFITMWCNACWWSDEWDASAYAAEYDPTRSFIDQVGELMHRVPQAGLYIVPPNENCDFTNFVTGDKNVYLSFSTAYSENVTYSRFVDFSKEISDSLNVQKSELCYECVDCVECYGSAYLMRGVKCSGVYFSRDLEDCTDCFGCVNLRHKQFCWFNEQLDKQEYEKRLKNALGSRESLGAAQKLFETHAQKFPVEFANLRNAVDSSGDNLRTSANAYHCFDSYDLENVTEGYRLFGLKDAYRAAFNIPTSLQCNVISANGSYDCAVSAYSLRSAHSRYVFFCFDSDSIFGCVGLRKKKFCILNKEYSEQEYHTRVAKITADMKARGEWGNFFSKSLVPFAYNDTIASDFFPLTKEAAIALGFRWSDTQRGMRGKETMKSDLVPGTTDMVSDQLLKEVLACTSCGNNYRLLGNELKVLRALKLVPPLRCQLCRYLERMKRHSFPKLYPGKCNKCAKAFETPYAPDRKEILYCKECYQTEIV